MAKFDVYYDEFNDLWLRDDPEWVKDRKKFLKKFLKNIEQYYKGSLGDANYKQQFVHYFVYGELLRYPDQIIKDFRGYYEMLLCIPWSNQEELERVFYFRLYSASDRSEISNYFLSHLSFFYRDMPEEWPKISLFSDVIWGTKYNEIKASDFSDELIVSPDPARVMSIFFQDALKLFLGDLGDGFTWLNCSFDYFISCADYVAEHQLDFEPQKLRRLFIHLKTLNGIKPREFGQNQQEVYDKLYPYLMAESAPQFIVDVREEIMT
jgi:hypothetical protein